nr:hypothetical protein BaRGS_027558 [Batillaria attramentaria]
MRAAFVDGVRVKDKIVRVKWIISSDWKALSLLKGVNSANANHFCLWCLCTKREITDFTSLVYHVPEALEKLSYIKDVGIAQVERKNYDQHLQFFQGTSRQGGAARKKVTQQILERENRLLYYRRYPNA